MQNISEQYFNQLQNTLGKLDQALGRIDESILWLDEGGSVEWSNTVFNELAQRIRIEILGQSINDIITVSLNNKSIPLFTIIKSITDHGKSEIVILTLSDQVISLQISAKKITAKDNKPYFIAVLHNVTEREKLLHDLMQKDKELSNLTNHLDGIIKSMSNMLIVISHKLDITLVNNSTTETLGYSSDELIGQPLHNIFEVQQGDTELIQELVKSGGVVNQESTYKTKSGEKIPILFSASILKDPIGKSSGVVCVAQDISQLKRAKDEIIYLASHDGLTNLPNRSEFEKVLNREVARSLRHKTISALLFIDLDNFKHINDSLGHYAGDQVLMEISMRLKSSHRQEDMIARLTVQDHFIGRLGGDEFVILLSDLQQPYDAGSYARRLASIIAKPINVNGFDLHVTTSIGIAVIPYAGTTSQALMKNADIAMYRAKEKGRNHIEYYTKSLSNIYKKRLSIENGLYDALENKEFHLVYQPQYELQTQKIRGFEALLRWNDPKLGQVDPDDFIPVAEKSRLIIPIGEWVIKEACQQLYDWQSQGLIDSSLKMSINVSPYQLIKEKLVKIFSKILHETNLKPQCIELEITETALMTRLEGSEEVLNDLKKLGVYISIDDFGTGYSSLARIKELPINTLKIDKSFIGQVIQSKNDSIIVKSIIGLAKSLELSVIAEGVESKEQVQYLIENGCELVQGFYFSKPLPVSQIEDLLKALG